MVWRNTASHRASSLLSPQWVLLSHTCTVSVISTLSTISILPVGRGSCYVIIYNIYTIYILSTLPAGRGCRPRHRSRSSPAVPRPPGGSASLCPDTAAPTLGNKISTYLRISTHVYLLHIAHICLYLHIYAAATCWSPGAG